MRCAALLIGLCLGSCLAAGVCTTANAAANDSNEGRPALSPELARKWARSCALCHVTGNGGAPRVGHPEEWRPRLAQGRDTLLQHAVAGYRRMPPLGYCMACDRGDLIGMIDYMTGTRSTDGAAAEPAR